MTPCSKVDCPHGSSNKSFTADQNSQKLSQSRHHEGVWLA